MPWTLYRYILRELGAVLAVTTLALVVVLSFFVAIKPMADGLLGAYTLGKFVVYTMPTVLGFALPFAGAFASTLVFNRLASDNEITAFAASGLSYKRILLPVVGLGLALTIGLLLLANFVVPGYYKKAARLVEADMITVMINRLNQGMPFEVQDFVLYADRAEQIPADEIPPPRSGLKPSQLIMLDGVAAGQIGSQGGMQRDVTAQRAAAFVYRRQGDSWVEVMLRNAMFYDPIRGEMGWTESYPIAPVALPSPFEDRPEFMSYGELQALGEHPQRFDEVAEASRKLEHALQAEMLRQDLVNQLSGKVPPGGPETARPKSSVTLIGPVEEETYTLKVGRVNRAQEVLKLSSTDDQPVELQFRRRGQLVWRAEAQSGEAEVTTSELRDTPVALIELTEARVYEPGPQQTFTERPRLTLPRLRWREEILGNGPNNAPLSTETLKDISNNAALADVPSVEQAQHALGRKLLALALRIISQKHKRAAAAVSCLLLLVLGSVLSIHLRRQLPLVLYFWSFMLAVVTLVIIYTGANLTQNVSSTPIVGLTVMWSGNLVLAVVIASVYCRLAKT